MITYPLILENDNYRVEIVKKIRKTAKNESRGAIIANLTDKTEGLLFRLLGLNKKELLVGQIYDCITTSLVSGPILKGDTLIYEVDGTFDKGKKEENLREFFDNRGNWTVNW